MFAGYNIRLYPEYTYDNQYIILKTLSIRQLLAYYQYFIVGVIAKHNFEL